MGEWNVFLVLVAIVGFFFTVGAPIIKLNTNITKLNASLESIQKDQVKLERDNHDAHKRIWDHNDEQDKMLEEHRLRLHDLDGK